MKYLMTLTVGACLLFSSVRAVAADEAAVRKAVEKLVATYSSHDTKTLLTLIDETIAAWEDSEQGKAAEEKRLREGFNNQKNMRVKLAQEIGIVFVAPDVAIYKAHVDVTGLAGEDGKPQPPMKRLNAWVMKKKDGDWLLAAIFSRLVES